MLKGDSAGEIVGEALDLLHSAEIEHDVAQRQLTNARLRHYVPEAAGQGQRIEAAEDGRETQAREPNAIHLGQCHRKALAEALPKEVPQAEDPHFFGCRWLSGDAGAVVHFAGRARLIFHRSMLQGAEAHLGKKMRQAHNDQCER